MHRVRHRFGCAPAHGGMRAIREAAPSLAVVVLMLLRSSAVQACERAAPWSRLGTSAQHTAEPLPLILVGGAITAPLVMAPTGADHELRVFSQRSLGGEPNAEPVSVWTPFVLPVILIGVDSVAHATDECDVARPASAMLQAMGMTFVTAAGLKWVTGRSWPNAGGDPGLPDRLDHPEFARKFSWFSLGNGTAWPSAHTATMMAAATALTTATYGRSWLGYVTLAAATGVGAGMWLGDHHWASDIVSGALLGVALGRSSGLAFRQQEQPAAAWKVTVLPWKTGDIQGLRAMAVW